MTQQHITCDPATDAETSEILALISAQETRQYELDARLRMPLTRDELTTRLAQHRPNAESALVARDAWGHVRGYVQPTLWELSATSTLLAFLTTRNGIAQSLTLPAPTSEDAQMVARALFSALDIFWRDHNTTGELIRWPAHDIWLEPLLLEHGFLLDSACAFRPSLPLPASRRVIAPPLHIRPARPEDEEMLVTLFHEELLFHKPYTPFVRSNPAVLHAFRSGLHRLWANNIHLEDGTPIVYVVEWEQQIVAMAEATLLEVGPYDEPGFTAPGRYGCLDNVIVQAGARRQGIGYLLVQTVLAAFASIPLSGYVLWYNPDNPLAHTFWRSHGFLPLWYTYQRLHTNDTSFPATTD